MPRGRTMHDLRRLPPTPAPGPALWGHRQVILAIGCVLVISWLLGAALELARPSLNSSTYLQRTVGSSLVVSTSLATAAWWFGPRHTKRRLTTLGMRSLPLSTLAAYGLSALAGSLVLTAGYFWVIEVLSLHMLMPPTIAETLPVKDAPLLSLFLVAGVAPLGEEVFFRGFVFTGLSAAWNERTAALVSSGLFAAAHMHVGLLIPTFLSGLLLVWVFHRTRSLWPAVAAHGTQNALAVASSFGALS